MNRETWWATSPQGLKDSDMTEALGAHTPTGLKKGELSYTVGENVNWYSHYEKTIQKILKKTKNIDIPHDSAIPLLGIYLKET